MYKITLPVKLNEFRYGIKFDRGIGETDNDYIASVMIRKGFAVEHIEDNSDDGDSQNGDAGNDNGDDDNGDDNSNAQNEQPDEPSQNLDGVEVTEPVNEPIAMANEYVQPVNYTEQVFPTPLENNVVDLQKMTIPEIRAFAADHNIPVNSQMNKQEMVQYLGNVLNNSVNQ